MKITNSNIHMAGKSFMVSCHEKKESLRMWVGNRRLNVDSSSRGDTIKLSGASGGDEAKESATRLSPEEKTKILIIEKMLKMLTGKDIKIKIPRVDKEADQGSISQEPSQFSGRAGWGFEYSYHETYGEEELMSFSADGFVRTEDGREINFRFEFSLKRSYFSENRLTFRAGDALYVDPLVINFENNTVELTDRKYDFDIDSDGKPDKISFVRPGSGFLAIDLNGDGIINNGSELFGTRTGNGFLELATFDYDRNGWIDESDSVFKRLLVWSKDLDGNDVISSLVDKRIGAIYLNSINAIFHIKDIENKEQGLIKKAGIFLKEDGKVGSVMHLDLTV